MRSLRYFGRTKIPVFLRPCEAVNVIRSVDAPVNGSGKTSAIRNGNRCSGHVATDFCGHFASITRGIKSDRCRFIRGTIEGRHIRRRLVTIAVVSTVLDAARAIAAYRTGTAVAGGSPR